MNTTVTGFRPVDARWRIDARDREPLHADALVVATGGLSVPSTGSDGGGLRIVEAMGHAIQPTYPALTPLIAHPAPFAALSGISLPVTITARADGLSSTATGGFLFTHHGYSGPAVLDVSHVAVRSRAQGISPAVIKVRWTTRGEEEWTQILKPQGSQKLLSAVAAELPLRLAEALIEAAGIDPRLSLAHLGRPDRLRLIDTLVRGELPWTGDEGYKKAEVTGGGVSLTDIDPEDDGEPADTRAFFSAERCSTPSGPSAATTSSGPGRRAGRPGWEHLLQLRVWHDLIAVTGPHSPTEGFSS